MFEGPAELRRQDSPVCQSRLHLYYARMDHLYIARTRPRSVGREMAALYWWGRRDGSRNGVRDGLGEQGFVCMTPYEGLCAYRRQDPVYGDLGLLLMLVDGEMAAQHWSRPSCLGSG